MKKVLLTLLITLFFLTNSSYAKERFIPIELWLGIPSTGSNELKIASQKCLNLDDEEFSKVSKEWSEGILKVFNSFPRFDWEKSQ